RAGPCLPRAAPALPVRLPLDALVVDAEGAKLAEHRLHEAWRGRGACLECLAPIPGGDRRAARVDDAGGPVRDELLEQGLVDAALPHARAEARFVWLAGEGVDHAQLVRVRALKLLEGLAVEDVAPRLVGAQDGVAWLEAAVQGVLDDGEVGH